MVLFLVANSPAQLEIRFSVKAPDLPLLILRYGWILLSYFDQMPGFLEEICKICSIQAFSLKALKILS